MPRPDPDQELLPSVLDRLIDLDPKVSSESQSYRSGRLTQLKQSVKRDLEWLLNSRRLLVEIPPGLTHLQESLLTFGLPDFTHSSISRSEDQVALRQIVESAIARFEPRLTQVNVTLVEGKQFDRTLRFRIDGILEVEPTPEAVSFDSVLQLLTKTFKLEGE